MDKNAAHIGSSYTPIPNFVRLKDLLTVLDKDMNIQIIFNVGNEEFDLMDFSEEAIQTKILPKYDLIVFKMTMNDKANGLRIDVADSKDLTIVTTPRIEDNK